MKLTKNYWLGIGLSIIAAVGYGLVCTQSELRNIHIYEIVLL